MDIGPWIISGLALAQVWIIALIKWAVRPKLRIYETGNLELGYGSLGPSIAVIGTLHVNKKSVFVREIRASVKCKEDQATRKFTWKAFRGMDLLPEKPKLEIVGGFLVTESSPVKFNIFLADNDYLSHVSPKLKSAPSRWMQYKQTRIQNIAEKIKEDAGVLNENEIIIESVYTDFTNESGLLEEYMVLDQAFYWKPGTYELTVEVVNEKNSVPCSFVREFDVTEEQSKELRLNCVQQCRELVGLSTNYFFVYPEYKSLN